MHQKVHFYCPLQTLLTHKVTNNLCTYHTCIHKTQFAEVKYLKTSIQCSLSFLFFFKASKRERSKPIWHQEFAFVSRITLKDNTRIHRVCLRTRNHPIAMLARIDFFAIDKCRIFFFLRLRVNAHHKLAKVQALHFSQKIPYAQKLSSTRRVFKAMHNTHSSHLRVGENGGVVPRVVVLPALWSCPPCSLALWR